MSEGMPENITPKLGDDFDRVKEECYRTAESHGFHAARLNQDARIARNMTVLSLFTSEIGEAVEALRHVAPESYLDDLRRNDGYYEELADLLIRFLDHIAELEREDPSFDFARVVKEKMEYNSRRERMHGKGV
jgi:NTP pyrophosphatase (non-canonical NTP hydrolase)